MTSEAKFRHHAEVEPVEMLPGVVRRTLVWGEQAMVCEFTIRQGAVIPPHRHVHEQVGYMASGRLEFTVEGVAHVVGPGDGYAIPSNALHTVVALEDAVAIDVFTPVREEYK